jgi:CubicO group peptidase (beta-lactamase class C family)
MQRALIIVVMVALVIAAITAGALAAHWPFWQRAWQWHVATAALPEARWPEKLAGPTRTLQPAAQPISLSIAVDPSLEAASQTGTSQAGTTHLMVGDSDGRTRAHFAAGVDGRTPVDGRGLSNGLVVLLYGALMHDGRMNLLDEPVGNTLAQWHDDPRGAITPRQLFWQLSGLAGTPFRPLNPFSPLAQLASGPDFQRAVLRTPLRYPPGSHFAESTANAQLLALVASSLSGESHGDALQRLLWSRVAADPATGLLDRRRGELAAHCCFIASAGDWLRLGLLLANHGRAEGLQILPEEFVDEVATVSAVNPGQGLGFQVMAGADGKRLLQLATTGRRLMVAPDSGGALLWVGVGEPPGGLADLLLQGQ